jgi:YidC/Oxa1 family membrane protein insertase
MNLSNFLLNGTVQFPFGRATGWFPFIGEFVYILISWIHAHGAIGYGLAIILFTVVFKLILSPLDFLTKYLSKRNSNKLAKMKPEEDELKRTYGADPMKLMAARRELYARHNYKMGGFMLFMMLNMFVTLVIFFSVYAALRNVASYNIALTVQELQATLHQTENSDEQTRADALNATYKEHAISFLWIDNVWKQDALWAPAGLELGEYLADASSTRWITTENEDGSTSTEIVQLSTEDRRQEYALIMGCLDKKYQRSWNGLFLLIVLSGVTTWGSAFINTKVMAAKRREQKAKEPIVGYSMRTAVAVSADGLPTMDPAATGKIMQIVLPVMMILFTLTTTAALAIYIVTNSILSTAFTFGMNWPVNKLVAWREKRDKRSDTIDTNIINPHAKYFKTKRKK